MYTTPNSPKGFITDVEINGLERSIINSGLPMLTKSLNLKDEKENLKFQFENHDLVRIIKRINYVPEKSKKTNIVWHRKAKNQIKLVKNHAEIILRNNEGEEIGRSKIDLDDIVKIENNKFNYTTNGYASNGLEGLHRCILNAKKNEYVDHINGDTLDNRKYNLRICSNKENTRNCKASKNSTSGSTGVSYKKDRNKWKAYITTNEKLQKHLGYFTLKEDAIKARKEAEKKYFGEFRKDFTTDEKDNLGLAKAIKHFSRILKLGSCQRGSGHDSALKGIHVAFLWNTPVAFQPHILRYHHIDIVSSQSSMHKIKDMDHSKSYNQNVSIDTIKFVESLMEQHIFMIEEDLIEMFIPELGMNVTRKELYEAIILNTPQGMMKTADYVTNYLQLKTMFLQRIVEPVEMWTDFCDWCLTLPFFKELCLKDKTDWTKTKTIEKGLK